MELEVRLRDDGHKKEHRLLLSFGSYEELERVKEALRKLIEDGGVIVGDVDWSILSADAPKIPVDISQDMADQIAYREAVAEALKDVNFGKDGEAC
jgi:hypothetical protein